MKRSFTWNSSHRLTQSSFIALVCALLGANACTAPKDPDDRFEAGAMDVLDAQSGPTDADAAVTDQGVLSRDGSDGSQSDADAATIDQDVSDATEDGASVDASDAGDAGVVDVQDVAVSDMPTVDVPNIPDVPSDVPSCMANLQTDPMNCGACGNQCAAANGVATCVAGVCGLGSCNANFANCNANAADGCEVDLRSSDSNCGTCGRACSGGGRCTASHCPTDPLDVVGGRLNSCQLSYGGTVRCWGGNDENESNRGSYLATSVAADVEQAPPNITQIAHHYGTVCVRHGAANNVSCWGSGTNGQLGDGSQISRGIIPRLVQLESAGNPSLADVAEIAVGSFHNCARRNDGTVACWGSNGFGQVGDGSMVATRLRAVVLPGINNAISIAANDYNTYVVTRAGDVLACGANFNQQLGGAGAAPLNVPTMIPTLSGIRLVRAGASTACAITDRGGNAYCWGYNGLTALGAAPQAVAIPRAFGALDRITDMHLGLTFVCALRDDGTVWCAGGNNRGQLGQGNTMNLSAPTQVRAITNAVAIGGGREHTCVVRADNTVACWGFDETGQLGSGRALVLPSPRAAFDLMDTPVQLSAGDTTTCYRTMAGNAYCWGGNFYGEVGTRNDVPVTTAQQVVGIANSTQISTGFLSSCSRGSANGGTLECWGFNQFGQVGANAMGNAVLVPATVPLMNVVSVHDRGGTVCAIHNTGAMGQLGCWGRNSAGELDGMPANIRFGPVDQGLTNVTQVATGYGHICAVRNGNSAICWGNGASGEFGNGEMPAGVRSAVQAAGALTVRTSGGIPYDFLKIGAGFHYTCGINAAHNVVCWGNNNSGQLGQPAGVVNWPFGVVVSGLPAGMTYDLAVGASHACARTGIGSGDVYCWGDNFFGENGTGSLAIQTFYSAQRVTLPMAAVEITAGVAHTCARLIDNSIHCWGQNYDNQCGTRDPIFRTAPITAR